jgi:hypothetical protein
MRAPFLARADSGAWLSRAPLPAARRAVQRAGRGARRRRSHVTHTSAGACVCASLLRPLRPRAWPTSPNQPYAPFRRNARRSPAPRRASAAQVMAKRTGTAPTQRKAAPVPAPRAAGKGRGVAVGGRGRGAKKPLGAHTRWLCADAILLARPATHRVLCQQHCALTPPASVCALRAARSGGARRAPCQGRGGRRGGRRGARWRPRRRRRGARQGPRRWRWPCGALHAPPTCVCCFIGASAKELGTQALTCPLLRCPTQAQPKPSQAELDAELDSYMALAPPEATAGGADAAAPMAA